MKSNSAFPLLLVAGSLLAFGAMAVKDGVVKQLQQLKFALGKLSLHNIKILKSDLSAKIRITNPDVHPVTYSNVRFDLAFDYNGRKIGTVNQVISVNIPPASDIYQEVTTTLDHLKVGMSVIDALKGDTGNSVRVTGTVKYASYTVNVDLIKTLEV